MRHSDCFARLVCTHKASARPTHRILHLRIFKMVNQCAGYSMEYNSRMTRSELIAALAEKNPSLTAADVEVAVKSITEAISRHLIQDGRIEIRDFGTFSLNYRPPRNGRNPKTGERVHVPEKRVPHFKPGKGLRERVNSVEGESS